MHSYAVIIQWIMLNKLYNKYYLKALWQLILGDTPAIYGGITQRYDYHDFLHFCDITVTMLQLAYKKDVPPTT